MFPSEEAGSDPDERMTLFPLPHGGRGTAWVLSQAHRDTVAIATPDDMDPQVGRVVLPLKLGPIYRLIQKKLTKLSCVKNFHRISK